MSEFAVRPSESAASVKDRSGVIFLISCIFFFNMLSRLGMAPLMPEVERELDIAHVQAGSMFLAISLGYGLGLFTASFMNARIRHHMQMVLSSITLGVTLIFCSMAGGPWGLRAGMFVLGIAGGLYLPSGVAVLTSIVRREQWGLALSVHQLSPNLAYVCSPLLANLLMAWYSWRTVLVIYGIAAIAMGLFFVPFNRYGNFCGKAPGKKVVFSLLTDRRILILITLFFLALGVNQGVFAMMPLYLTVQRGFDPTWANKLLGMTRVAAFAFPLVTGWLADRYGLKRTLYVVITVNGLAACFIAASPDNLVGLGLFCQAVASVCFFPLGFAVMSKITTADTRSVAVAVTVPIGHLLGAGLVPTIIGLFGDIFNFNAGLYILGGLTLAGVFLLRFIEVD